MNSRYTEQAELDIQGLSARWACTFCTPIIAGEIEQGRKFTPEEIDRILGRAFRTGAAWMCNYKNHARFYTPYPKDQPGWSEAANPEMHYWVEDWELLIMAVERVMGHRLDTSRFEVGIVRVFTNSQRTQTGGHYILRVDKTKEYDPDPRLIRDLSVETKWRPMLG